MSSLFQGLSVNGKLKTTAGPAVTYFRGLGFAADGGLAIGSGPAVAYTAGIPTNAQGQIVASSNAVAQYGPGGLPLDSAGAVVFRDEVPVYYSNGVGYGVSNALARGFSPLDLFAAGEAGAWYDPSDLSTMFQTNTSDTPAVIEGPVGLLLDKKAQRGSTEYVTNGSFDSGTSSWFVGNGTIGWVNGWATLTASGTASAQIVQSYNNFTTAVGKWIELTIDFRNKVGSQGIQAVIYNASTGFSSIATCREVTATSGRLRCVGYVPPNTNIQYGLSFNNPTPVGGNYVELDNVSIRDLPGNHMVQATAGSRPILRARYNRLSYSDMAGGSFNVPPTGWSGGAVNSTPVGLDGEGNVIWRQIASASRTHFDYAQLLPVGVNGAAATLHLRIGVIRSGSLSIESVIWWAGLPVDATLLWYRNGVQSPSSTPIDSYDVVSVVAVMGATNQSIRPRVGLGAQSNQTGDIEFSKPQVDYGNTGAKPNTYQKTTGASGYDTGPQFSPYLDFDGVDDGMATAGNIDFSATDKMTLCVGLTKKSDVNSGMVVETSVSASANVGVFQLRAPNGAAPNFLYGVRQSSEELITATPYPAPISAVLTGQSNFAGTGSLRTNGASVAGTGGTGAGNFGNFAMYVGRRAGTSLPLNGSLYGLIVRGAQSTAAQVSGMESYMASKMGPAAPVLP